MSVLALVDVPAVDVLADWLVVSCMIEGRVLVNTGAVDWYGVEELLTVVSKADVAGVAVVDVCVAVDETAAVVYRDELAVSVDVEAVVTVDVEAVVVPAAEVVS